MIQSHNTATQKFTGHCIWPAMMQHSSNSTGECFAANTFVIEGFLVCTFSSLLHALSLAHYPFYTSSHVPCSVSHSPPSIFVPFLLYTPSLPLSLSPCMYVPHPLLPSSYSLPLLLFLNSILLSLPFLLTRPHLVLSDGSSATVFIKHWF